MQVDVTVTNNGPARLVDVYFGALLPALAGPGFGCPARDAIAFVTRGARSGCGDLLDIPAAKPPDVFADGRVDPTDPPAAASQGLTFAP